MENQCWFCGQRVVAVEIAPLRFETILRLVSGSIASSRQESSRIFPTRFFFVPGMLESPEVAGTSYHDTIPSQFSTRSDDALASNIQPIPFQLASAHNLDGHCRGSGGKLDVDPE